MSASAVAQWEHPSGTQPSLQSLVRILEITGVSPDWLVMGKASRPRPASEVDSELPAVSLDVYAHSLQEEGLLRAFRQIPTSRRSLLILLAEEFAGNRGRSSSKSRLKR